MPPDPQMRRSRPRRQAASHTISDPSTDTTARIADGADDADLLAAAAEVDLPSGRPFLDLGNGQAAVFGTAADMAAAADYLTEHYPDGPVGPQVEAVQGPVLAMGWRLAEEVAWARPDRAGPEWWTLLDLAQSGRDETRRSMPGREYLLIRGRCSRATLYRRLQMLAKAGLIVVAVQPAPGRRAVYEITAMVTRMAAERQALMPDTSSQTGLTDTETRTGLTGAETRTSDRVSDPARQVSDPGPTGLSVSESPLVSTLPSAHPSSLSRALGELAAAVPRLTEREILAIGRKLEDNPAVPSPAAYLRQIISNGDGAEFAIRTLNGSWPARSQGSVTDQRMAAAQALKRGARPRWCGTCDERTRQIELPDGRAARCPQCSASAAQPDSHNGGQAHQDATALGTIIQGAAERQGQ